MGLSMSGDRVVLNQVEPIGKDNDDLFLNGIRAFPRPTLGVGDLVRANHRKWIGNQKLPKGVGIVRMTNWMLVKGSARGEYRYIPKAHVVWPNMRQMTAHSHDSLEVVNAVRGG